MVPWGGNPIVIRPASPSDAAGIARVHVESWRTTYAGLIANQEIARRTVEVREKQWSGSLVRVDEFIFIASDAGGQILGFASGGPERDGDRVYRGELYAIYLIHRAQRQGVGRRLVTAVAAELFEHGLPSMLVWVLADNPSRNFYAALGGRAVFEKQITLGSLSYREVAYGWEDIEPLARQAGRDPGVC